MPTSRALRIVFLGTPEIAVPTLERLIAGPHAVVGVVSQPDRGRGRGRKASPSPVAEIALREGLPLLRPERVGEPETLAALRALEPDLGVVVAFGQFIPKALRELPACGYLINAHASLLPRYRGASPIARAILEGEEETGISVMRVVREMDAGPVGLELRTKIGSEEDTAALSARLAELAADAIEQAVDRIAEERIEWTEQDESQATLAPKLTKADALLDLREPAERLARHIRALTPQPGALLRMIASPDVVSPKVDLPDVASTPREGGATIATPIAETLKVARASSEPFEAGERPRPGSIRIDEPGRADPLRIATGEGWLRPGTLQRPGGRALPTADFLRGFPIPDGARFALPSDAPDEAPDPTMGEARRAQAARS